MVSYGDAAVNAGASFVNSAQCPATTRGIVTLS
jgi:hypothetical protein